MQQYADPLTISPHCLSKDLCVRRGHCGTVGKDYANSNYSNRTAMSHKLRTKACMETFVCLIL